MSREQYDFSFLDGIKPSPQKKKEEELIKKYDFSFLDEFKPIKAEVPLEMPEEEKKESPFLKKIGKARDYMMPIIMQIPGLREQFRAPEPERTGEKAWKPEIDMRLVYDLLGGFYSSAGKAADIFDKYSQILSKTLSKKLGIPEEKLRGGLFENLMKDWVALSQQFREKGMAEGIVKEVGAGVGGAAFDIPAIMSFGKLGLPIHGAIYGGAEEGIPGAAVGAVRGALIHKTIQGIGLLPSKLQIPGWAGFGAVTTPGGVEERAAGALTWAALGLSGGSRKVTIEEFLDRYPKIKDKIDESKARKILKKIASDVKDLEIEESGGAKVVLDESFKSMMEISEITKKPETWMRPEKKPPKLAPPATRIATEEGVVFEPGTPEAEVIKERYRAAEPSPPAEQVINVKSRADGSVDITVKPSGKPEWTKQDALESLWAIYEAHPRLLYERIKDHPYVKEGNVTLPEVVDYFEARGKEVIGKPEKKAEKAKKGPTFKDPLHQIIFDEGRIKPNQDFSRKELLKILPVRLIASEKDPSAKAMDIMAQTVKREFPFIEGDAELYHELLARKKAPVEESFEKAERERIEREYEEFEAEKVPEAKISVTTELAEKKLALKEFSLSADEASKAMLKKHFPELFEEHEASGGQGTIRLNNLLQRAVREVDRLERKAEKARFEKEWAKVEEGEAILRGEKPEEEYVERFKESQFKPPKEIPASKKSPEVLEKEIRAHLENKTPKEIKEFLADPSIEQAYKPYIKKLLDEKLTEKPEEPPTSTTPVTAAPTPPSPEIPSEKVSKKGELFRMSPAARKLEKLFREGKLKAKELTEEEKEFLTERGMYEKGKAPPKPKPLTEAEIEEASEKERGPYRPMLTKISIEDPTGKVETFEITEALIGGEKGIRQYAKNLGILEKVKIGQPYPGRWKEHYSPAEHEKTIKQFLRDVKKVPKEKWESWEKEVDEEHQKIYSGLAPPEFVRTVGQRILAKLQIEPQFKAVGGPDTGLAVKRYHPIRNAEVERGEAWIKKLKKLKYSPEDYQELTKIAAKPTKFFPMSKEDRAKFSPGYQIISGKKGFFKEYEARLKELDVIEEGWPKSQLNRLREEEAHIKAVMQRTKKMKPERKEKLKNRLKDIYDSIEFIKKSHPQYVHIPRMWFEMIWDRNPITAPRIITELFKQRETLDIEKLANYLLETKVRDLVPRGEWDLYKAKDLDRPLLKPEDLDIRRIMLAYSHKVGHKIALAEIFRNAEKEGLLRDTDLAPQDWVQMPSRLYPTLKGKRAHPVLADFFETNFVRKGFMPPKLGGVLGTIKLMQFYNPLFLPMYDVVQAWWAGSVRSVKTPSSIRKAYSSMKNKDSHYWDIHNWGGFSTPYTPSFETYMKRADSIVKENSFIKNLVKLKYINPYELYKLSWKAAWTGDHFIRMITYHHYLSKGFTPREAAQTTAKLHADYASIPPSTRKWINKIFFTPSFKISMMAAQAEMVKNAGRALTKAGREKMTVQDKAMAKALIGLASGIAIREGIMHALGFKTDQFGLKYYKEIETEEGKKELVLHAATPDNVVLRFFHRFKNILPIFGKEEQKLTKLVDRAKWEFHPLWQTSMELYSNKSVSLEPIYNKFDKPEKIAADVLGYTAKRLIRITELIPGMSESIKRRDAYNALIKDLDGFGVVLSGFTLPYVRTTREKALVWEINRLKRTFKWMKEDDPAKTSEEAERRLKKFRDQLEKLRERLKEMRAEE